MTNALFASIFLFLKKCNMKQGNAEDEGPLIEHVCTLTFHLSHF